MRTRARTHLHLHARTHPHTYTRARAHTRRYELDTILEVGLTEEDMDFLKIKAPMHRRKLINLSTTGAPPPPPNHGAASETHAAWADNSDQN